MRIATTYQVPRYRAIRDVHPASKERFRHEPPFTTISDNDEWQYGTRPIKAGETVETTSWPHTSFFPLNYAAQQVLHFFNSAPKSRLPLSPSRNGQIHLDDGLTGPVFVDVRPPQLPRPFIDVAPNERGSA